MAARTKHISSLTNGLRPSRCSRQGSRLAQRLFSTLGLALQVVLEYQSFMVECAAVDPFRATRFINCPSTLGILR